MNDIITGLQNRKKLILGAVAYLVIYAFCRVVLNMDEAQSQTAGAGGALIVIERVGPIFGLNVDGPKVTDNGEVVVEVKPLGRQVKVEKPVALVQEVRK